MIMAARKAASPTPAAKIVLITLFFLIAGPLIAGPFAIAIIWYFSLPDMSIARAIQSGLVVTALGFWALIPAGAVPALATGLTTGWLEVTRGRADGWAVAGSGLLSGILWGLVLQYNITEFESVILGVAVGSLVGSLICWKIVRMARNMRTRRQA